MRVPHWMPIDRLRCPECVAGKGSDTRDQIGFRWPGQENAQLHCVRTASIADPGPLPQPLRLVADRGNILHDQLDVAAAGRVEEFAQVLLGPLGMPLVLGQDRRARFAAHHVVAADLLRPRRRVAPGADGNLPQVGDPPQDVDLAVQRLAAAIVGQAPAGKPAQIVLAGRTPSACSARLRRRSARWSSPTCCAAGRGAGSNSPPGNWLV